MQRWEALLREEPSESESTRNADVKRHVPSRAHAPAGQKHGVHDRTRLKRQVRQRRMDDRTQLMHEEELS